MHYSHNPTYFFYLLLSYYKRNLHITLDNKSLTEVVLQLCNVRLLLICTLVLMFTMVLVVLTLKKWEK